jgi:hypothetical protein
LEKNKIGKHDWKKIGLENMIGKMGLEKWIGEYDREK